MSTVRGIPGVKMAVTKRSLMPVICMTLLLSLASCGFTPVYGNNSSARAMLENITLDEPKSRIEYVFLKAFEERVPPRQDAQYLVRYRVDVKYQGLDVIGVSRVQVVGTITAELVDKDTETVKFQTAVDGFTSYTDTSGFQADQQRNAEDRLMQILADKFITRLMIHSGELSAEAG
jgi:LPS-assembly lipoprotein